MTVLLKIAIMGVICCHTLQTVYSNPTIVPISKNCLGCICEASSGCTGREGCQGTDEFEICGPFRINYNYWLEAGRITLEGERYFMHGARQRCLDDLKCASKVVRAYMERFHQDCDGDNLITCDDYAQIHLFGNDSCSCATDIVFQYRFRRCMHNARIGPIPYKDIL